MNPGIEESNGAMLLDVVHEEGQWSIYLGTWRLFRNLTLLAALRLAGYRVVEARD